MRVKKLSGDVGNVDDGAVEALRTAFRGDILSPGASSYEEARKVFNAVIDRRPALIARCRSAADVVSAVNFARQNDLMVSIRGGGCDVAGKAIVDGGVVIDMSKMTGVHVSAAKKTARIEAGAIWAGVDRETALHGLAAVGGTVAKVGVAGFTLGGGVGFLSRSHGLACDNVLSFDVVLADGRVVVASPSDHSDLYWALRGGGVGNFGVVTSFEVQLHEVKPMLGGLAVFPLARGREALETYRQITRTAPDALGLACALIVHPQAGPVVAIAGCYNGNAVDGQELLKPVRELGPIMDAFRPLSYLELQGMLDPSAPAGNRHSWKGSFLQNLSDKAIATLIEHFKKVPPGPSQVLIEHLGGAVERVGRDQTAFAHRDARYTALIMGAASDEAGHKAAQTWARNLWDALRPLVSESVYVNYLSHEADENERVKNAFDTASWSRLAEIKQKYDPKNFFRHNHNVEPGAVAGDYKTDVMSTRERNELREIKLLLEALTAKVEGVEERLMEIEFEAKVQARPAVSPIKKERAT